MDTETVLRRLEARESVIPSSEPSTAQVARAFLALESESSGSLFSAQVVALRELASLELELSKLSKLVSVSQEEQKYYEEVGRTIEREIEKTQKQIHVLEKRLAEERLVRQRKEEREALAAQVNAERPRLETLQAIEETEKELAVLKAEQDKVNENLLLRQRQFQLLLHAIAELNNVLNTSSSSTQTSSSPAPIDQQ